MYVEERRGSRTAFGAREAAALIMNNALRHADALKVAAASFEAQAGGPDSPSATNSASNLSGAPLPETNASNISLTQRHIWEPHETQVLLQVAVGHPPGSKAPVNQLLKSLGWGGIPDPGHVLRTRVVNKFSRIRALLDNGVDPAEVGIKKKIVPNRTSTWTGTLDDVCAHLQADPDIAPLLDTRNCAKLRSVTIWRILVRGCMQKLPGLSNTGLKRGRFCVYRYKPQDVVVDGPIGKRARKRGQPGLPFLGKKSKNAN